MANVFSKLGCAMAGTNVETLPTSKTARSHAKQVILIAVQTVPFATTSSTVDVMGSSIAPVERTNKRVVSFTLIS